MALGERLHKDIYEALRAGPKWAKTLLAIVYDDGGDFYGVPASSPSGGSTVELYLCIG